MSSHVDDAVSDSLKDTRRRSHLPPCPADYCLPASDGRVACGCCCCVALSLSLSAAAHNATPYTTHYVTASVQPHSACTFTFAGLPRLAAVVQIAGHDVWRSANANSRFFSVFFARAIKGSLLQRVN